MSTELDLDDVAATSSRAVKELAALRAERDRMREALEKIVLSVEAYADPTRIEEWHGEVAHAALKGVEG
jgi:hypothetical protein